MTASDLMFVLFMIFAAMLIALVGGYLMILIHDGDVDLIDFLKGFCGSLNKFLTGRKRRK